MTSHSSVEVKRALVTLAIEKALLDTGGNKLLYDISMELFVNHKSYIQDCFEHPEHLRKILNGFEIRGKIIETIKNNLEEFSYEKPITEFLTKLTTT